MAYVNLDNDIMEFHWYMFTFDITDMYYMLLILTLSHEYNSSI